MMEDYIGTNQLDKVAVLRADLLASNSSTYKRKTLSAFLSGNSEDALVKRVLDMIFNSEKYLLTSKIFPVSASDVRHGITPSSVRPEEVSIILDMLASPEASAASKKSALICLHDRLDPEAAEVLECILDKDLKCGVSSSTYMKMLNASNDAIGLSLANKYADKKGKVDFEKDTWFVSRKLDGCRLNIIKRGDDVRALSRTGKLYASLQILIDAIKQIPGDFVLDGEVITKGGMEHDDFKSIVSQVKRKDYTIPDPVMMVFDIYSVDVACGRDTSVKFSERYKELQQFFDGNKDTLDDKFVIVEQKVITDDRMLMDEFAKASAAGWEGLMIRKDVPWEGKRTDNLLKLKEFNDGEFTIAGYTLGDFRYKGTALHNVLSAVDIDYKGHKCSVGSGWSLDERKKYAENPGALIGKTLKVKYFEETTNDKGEKSLRFPTKVYLYGDEGRFD